MCFCAVFSRSIIEAKFVQWGWCSYIDIGTLFPEVGIIGQNLVLERRRGDGRAEG